MHLLDRVNTDFLCLFVLCVCISERDLEREMVN